MRFIVVFLLSLFSVNATATQELWAHDWKMLSRALSKKGTFPAALNTSLTLD